MATTVNNEATLKAGGTSFVGAWEQVHIRKSMINLAGGFGFDTTDFFSKSKLIRMGDPVVVDIDGQPVNTGYIDWMPVAYDADGHFVHIKGRDKTADLVDSSYIGTVNEWKNQSVKNIIINMCAPYGIDVVVDTTVEEAANFLIETFKANDAESAYDQIKDLCIDNGILPLSYGDGFLTLTKVTTKRKATDNLEFGINVSNGRLLQDDRERYSEYNVKGLGISNDNKSQSDYIEPFGRATDSVIKRFKPLTIFQDRSTDSGRCEKRAKWEAALRAGFSRGIVYEVNEWIQKSGKIWDINMLVKVKDDFLGVNTEMVIAEVDYVLDEDSLRTMLLVVDKDTFSGEASEVRTKMELFDA